MSLLESAMTFLFLALSRASVLLLVAIGLSIVFGSLKFINMAHGALYVLGAFVGVIIASELNASLPIVGTVGVGLGLGFAAAVILTPVAIFILGIIMERGMAKPFYERDMLDQLLVTFGVLIILQELLGLLFGRGGHRYSRPDWASGPLPLPGMGTASRWRIYIIIATLVLVILILAFYRYTNYGLVVRAATEDSEMTSMLGIRVSRPFLLIFAIGAAYAGLAGIMDGAIDNFNYLEGIEMIIPALVIVIMGGVGSMKGTIVASLLAGFAWTTMWWVGEPWAQLTSASIYALAIVVLIIRPNGIYPTGKIS